MGFYDSIYADRELPARAKAVYLYLCGRCGAKGSCWPGVKTIATEMGMSRATVFRALDDLERHNYVEIVARTRGNGGKTSNLYKVN